MTWCGMAQWAMTWQSNGGSVTTPQCAACRGRKSHSEGFIKLWTISLWYFSCLCLNPHSFLSPCLSLSFGDMFFIWKSSCIIRGSEKQDGEGSGRGNTDVRQTCSSKQTLFFSVVARDAHENGGHPTQGCRLVETVVTCGVCNGARDTLHILLSLSLHLYQPPTLYLSLFSVPSSSSPPQSVPPPPICNIYL